MDIISERLQSFGLMLSRKQHLPPPAKGEMPEFCELPIHKAWLQPESQPAHEQIKSKPACADAFQRVRWIFLKVRHDRSKSSVIQAWLMIWVACIAVRDGVMDVAAPFQVVLPRY